MRVAIQKIMKTSVIILTLTIAKLWSKVVAVETDKLRSYLALRTLTKNELNE